MSHFLLSRRLQILSSLEIQNLFRKYENNLGTLVSLNIFKKAGYKPHSIMPRKGSKGSVLEIVVQGKLIKRDY